MYDVHDLGLRLFSLVTIYSLLKSKLHELERLLCQYIKLFVQ